MDNLESKIRDYLVKNINILSEDLTVIEKEHKLDNDLGARGFIDILAKDSNNNIVVIEIKRSKSASRSALHELNKYIALLKKNYHVKDSEVRLIIVSSEWDELLVPFSEYCKDVSLYIEGYKMILDNKAKPVKFEKVIPIEIDNSRAFSSQSMFFFFRYDNFNKCELLELLKQLMNRYGLLDYVVVNLKARYKKMPYKYGIYVAYKKYNKEYLLKFIKLADDDFTKDYKVLQNKIYFENMGENCDIEIENTCSFYNRILNYEVENKCNDEEYIDFIENEILILLNSQIANDEYESGYPMKFISAISRIWEVHEIIKYGLYNQGLLSDNNILIELSSIRENNEYIYNNYSESMNKAKILEICENFSNCLKNNSKWDDELARILSRIKMGKSNFRLSINIFNPCRILEVIARTICTQSYDYFPSYEVIVDYLDSNKVEIFRGMITWKKKNIDFNEFYGKFFQSSIDDFLIKTHFGTIEIIDYKIMEYLGLQYTSELISINGDEFEQSEIDIIHGKLNFKPIDKNRHPIYFDDFILSEQAFIKPLLDIFEMYTSNFVEDSLLDRLKEDE
jgi:Predicted nuclease of the RecB family